VGSVLNRRAAAPASLWCRRPRLPLPSSIAGRAGSPVVCVPRGRFACFGPLRRPPAVGWWAPVALPSAMAGGSVLKRRTGWVGRGVGATTGDLSSALATLVDPIRTRDPRSSRCGRTPACPLPAGAVCSACPASLSPAGGFISARPAFEDTPAGRPGSGAQPWGSPLWGRVRAEPGFGKGRGGGTPLSRPGRGRCPRPRWPGADAAVRSQRSSARPGLRTRTATGRWPPIGRRGRWRDAPGSDERGSRAQPGRPKSRALRTQSRQAAPTVRQHQAHTGRPSPSGV